MMAAGLLCVSVLWLAWSNGANDNFKGVATLYGSQLLSFRRALALASLATLAGALLSVLLAGKLVQTFSGHGWLAPGAIDTRLLVAVASGAAATVLLATVLGMPTSTTHALAGALLGAGWLATHGGVAIRPLLASVLLPLLLSPLISIGLANLLYRALRRGRQRLGLSEECCLCLTLPAAQGVATLPAAGEQVALGAELAAPSLVLARQDACVGLAGQLTGRQLGRALDGLHLVAGGAVCFARALNDTPKITALLLAASALPLGRLPAVALGLVAVTMVVGGLVQSRAVAITMSQRITRLNPSQGLTASLVTAGLVLAASPLGLPVSTTHVSCGSLIGLGLASGQRHWGVIGQVLLTWAVTLPLALLLGAAAYAALTWL